jgi:hypothetical protein
MQPDSQFPDDRNSGTARGERLRKSENTAILTSLFRESGQRVRASPGPLSRAIGLLLLTLLRCFGAVSGFAGAAAASGDIEKVDIAKRYLPFCHISLTFYPWIRWSEHLSCRVARPVPVRHGLQPTRAAPLRSGATYIGTRPCIAQASRYSTSGQFTRFHQAFT